MLEVEHKRIITLILSSRILEINTPDFIQIQRTRIPYIKPLSSRKLAKYIGSRLSAIEDTDSRNYLRTILNNIPELRAVRKLVQIFKLPGLTILFKTFHLF